MNQLSPVPVSSSLRDRLVEDMTVREFSDKTPQILGSEPMNWGCPTLVAIFPVCLGIRLVEGVVRLLVLPVTSGLGERCSRYATPRWQRPCPRAYVVGDAPTWRANATLNVLDEL